jgi:serine/threonine protein kinase
MAAPASRLYSNYDALSWSLDLARALAHIHSREPALVHRDVKAANVLLTAEGGRVVAKLADFGLHVVRHRACRSPTHGGRRSRLSPPFVAGRCRRARCLERSRRARRTNAADATRLHRRSRAAAGRASCACTAARP